MIDKCLADRITYLATAAGGLRPLAREIGTDAGYLAKIRSGKKNPSDVVLRKLSLVRIVTYEACDVPPDGWRCSRVKGHMGPCAARTIDVHSALQVKSMESAICKVVSAMDNTMAPASWPITWRDTLRSALPNQSTMEEP